MRVAVVGAGIFGCVAAVDLARAGHTVELYERHGDILHGASRANQGRLHHGYHYPRVGADMRPDARLFAARFPHAIRHDARHYYAIAAEGSKVNGPEFIEFCRRAGLPYHRHTPAEVRREAVDECVWVREAYVDLPALRGLLSAQLHRAGVARHLNTTIDPDDLAHDFVVRATYGRGWPKPLRWEVCETALLHLGRHMADFGMVVMDGEFISLDPTSRDLHMLYDVAHSVHHANVGTEPEIPDHLAPLIDAGVVRTEHSHVSAMLATAHRFLRGIGEPRYVGSMFTVRAVLPDVDRTDERPSLVWQQGPVISVLSGKICSAVTVAEQVGAVVREAALV